MELRGICWRGRMGEIERDKGRDRDRETEIQRQRQRDTEGNDGIERHFLKRKNGGN